MHSGEEGLFFASDELRSWWIEERDRKLEIVAERKDPGKPSLVLDLMEEFRQQVVDRTVITLLSKGVIKPDEVLAVERAEEGRVLDRNVVKTILTSLQERLDTKVMFSGQRAPIKRFVYSQARRVVRFLLRETGYAPFVLGW